MTPSSVILIEDHEPPRSKRALKRAVADDPRGVLIEDPSLDYGRTADELLEGEVVAVAGPEPGDVRFTAELTRWHGRVVVR